MSLNDYRDEAKEFLEKVGSENEPLEKDVERLEGELELLKQAENDSEIQHQTYDLLFILFGIAAKKDLNLDEEWREGLKTKKKYTEQK